MCCWDILGSKTKVMLFFVDAIRFCDFRFGHFCRIICKYENTPIVNCFQKKWHWRGYRTKENKSNKKGDERFGKSHEISNNKGYPTNPMKRKNNPTNSMGLEHFGDFIDFFCSDVATFSSSTPTWAIKNQQQLSNLTASPAVLPSWYLVSSLILYKSVFSDPFLISQGLRK